VRLKPGAEPLQAAALEERFIVVGAEAGSIHARTIFEEHSWFFLACFAKSNEFHALVSQRLSLKNPDTPAQRLQGAIEMQRLRYPEGVP
jgi:hypothetical protein